MLLERIRPEHERVQKAQAIAELDARVQVELQRTDQLISQRRLASYHSIRLRR